MVCWGDSLRIRQILMNLIGNAVKFTSRGEIVITADITQTQPGEARPTCRFVWPIPVLAWMRQRFSRYSSPSRRPTNPPPRRFGGSGLGLAICRELAETMGGSIRVDSHPQVGVDIRSVIAAGRGSRAIHCGFRTALSSPACKDPHATPGHGGVPGAAPGGTESHTGPG